MTLAVVSLTVASWLPVPAAAQTGQGTPIPTPGAWNGPRTPDGQPDIQGTFDAPLSGSFSLSNPMAGGGRFPFLAAGKEPPRNPSRVMDPPDGRVPYQPWAAALQQDQERHIEDPIRPEHVDTQNRCLLGGPSRGFYTTQARFVQFPGYVLVLFQQYQYFRIIRLGAPHLGQNIKLWMGDPVGRWEGNTLVVETTNVNANARLSMVGDFMTPNTRIVERFTFADRDNLTYAATYEDPSIYTRPWTMTVALKREPAEEEFWEYGCHEGERTSRNIDQHLGAGQGGKQ
jgi:hypothetical protein